MSNRWMAVALGAAVLAVPGTALAKGDHGKDKVKSHHKADKHAKKDKSAATKGKSAVFKGVYKGDGVVTVASGNSRVRKGGYVGRDVTFDLSTAKLVVADTDGVAGLTVADVQVGDVVLVQARVAKPAGDDEQPAAIVARKLVDKTHPPVASDDDDAAEHPDGD